jgi:putative tryptophan/tyrosine transport system substrate-binding protein
MSNVGVRSWPAAISVMALSIHFLAVSPTADAQAPGKPAKVGLLFLGSAEANAARGMALRDGLRALRWIEGQNVVFESRVAPGTLDGRFALTELVPLATELAQHQVDVIVAFGFPPSEAARQATATIPIVMAAVENPVGWNLVASLARPGGNVTGVTLDVFGQDLNAKRLEWLKAALPAVSKVAVSYTQSRNYHYEQMSRMEAAAPALGLEIRRIGLLGVEDLGRIFAQLQRDHVGAVRVQSDPVTDQWIGRIAELGLKHRLPTMCDLRSYVEAGGFMSYGPSLADLDRRAATYVDKILKGAKPADLPVEQPTKFELVLNLKTARAFGLTIPQSVFVRADEVIR